MLPRTHEETPETATPVTTRPKPSPQQDDEDEQQPAPVIDPPKNEPSSDAPTTADSPATPKPKLPTEIPPQDKLEPDCPPQDDTCNGGGGPVISWPTAR
jgi:hypothetical protein